MIMIITIITIILIMTTTGSVGVCGNSGLGKRRNRIQGWCQTTGVWVKIIMMTIIIIIIMTMILVITMMAMISRLACSRRETPEISSIQSLSNTSVMLVWQVTWSLSFDCHLIDHFDDKDDNFLSIIKILGSLLIDDVAEDPGNDNGAKDGESPLVNAMVMVNHWFSGEWRFQLFLLWELCDCLVDKRHQLKVK